MKQKVVLRADGNSTIGLGHILRLLALADMLKDDFFLSFALQEPNEYLIHLVKGSCHEIISLSQEVDFIKEANTFSTTHLAGYEIVVLDGYSFQTEYQKIVASKCKKLVFVDDLHLWHQYADVIINHAALVTPEVYDTQAQTQFCLGLNYALLRKEFLVPHLAKRNVIALKKVFLSMGGADVHNVTQKFIDVLARIDFIDEVTVLLGKMNVHSTSIKKAINENKWAKFHIQQNLSASDLCEELTSCQLAICPASTTALEVCAVGVGLLSGFTADNQSDILEGLNRTNCILNLGDLTRIPHEQIEASILDLIENTEILVKMMLAQNELIDGKSPERFLKLFTQLSHA